MRRSQLAIAVTVGLSLGMLAACGWDPKRPFERKSPEVEQAIQELDAGRKKEANERLSGYLAASRCDAGALTAPGAADAANAGFDLGLSLFGIAEQFGRRFGEPELDRDGGPDEEEKKLALLRGDQIDCARIVLDQILARDPAAELEARARYLRGNLAFLEHQWKTAIEDYDKALKTIPGVPADAGDAIGRDAAWNRALALRHKDEDDKKDAGADGDDGDADADSDAPDDSSQDAKNDAPNDAPSDGPQEAGADGGDGGNPDKGKDAGGDAGEDAGKKDPDQGKDAGQDDAAQPQPTQKNQDDRMLDQFEQAPTWQREEAKSRANGRRVHGMQDK